MENYLRVKQVTEGPYIHVVGLSGGGGGGGNIVLEFKPSSASDIITLDKNPLAYQSYIYYLAESPFKSADTSYANWALPKNDTETFKHSLLQAVIEVNGEQLTVKDDALEFEWENNFGYPTYKLRIRDNMPYDTAKLLSFTVKTDPAYNAVAFTTSSSTAAVNLNANDYGSSYNPTKLYAQGGMAYAKLKEGIKLEDVEIVAILQGGNDHQLNADAMQALKDGYLELTQDADGTLKLGLKLEYGSRLWSICALLLRVKQPQEIL